MSHRLTSVAGSFYPAESSSVLEMIERFNSILESHPDTLQQLNALTGNAVIVPHAGWMYSGFTANIAFRVLANNTPDTLVVIGPSHRVGFQGISISDMEYFQTPLGDLTINLPLVEDLMNRFPISNLIQAHHEHSTEVQMPFIKHYLPHAKVVEMVYSYAEPAQIKPIISYLLKLHGIAVVNSTDLSHYYSLEHANRLDSICLDAIQKEDVGILQNGCEACGIIGVEAMLDVAKDKHLESIILDYRTSADASGDSTRVVGYTSVLFR